MELVAKNRVLPCRDVLAMALPYLEAWNEGSAPSCSALSRFSILFPAYTTTSECWESRKGDVFQTQTLHAQK